MLFLLYVWCQLCILTGRETFIHLKHFTLLSLLVGSNEGNDKATRTNGKADTRGNAKVK